jgi:hypothetical protein
MFCLLELESVKFGERTEVSEEQIASIFRAED